MPSTPTIEYSRCGKKVRLNGSVIFVTTFNLLLKNERLLAIKSEMDKAKIGLCEAAKLINELYESITE